MRLEVTSAYFIGIALPVLEVMRRRSNFDNIPAYIDDFLVGALLLYAARAVTLKKQNGPVLLVAAWAVLCGGFYGSIFGQLQSSASQDVSGFSNAFVVLIKGVLYLVAIGSLIMAVRSVVPSKHG